MREGQKRLRVEKERETEGSRVTNKKEVENRRRTPFFSLLKLPAKIVSGNSSSVRPSTTKPICMFMREHILLSLCMLIFAMLSNLCTWISISRYLLFSPRVRVPVRRMRTGFALYDAMADGRPISSMFAQLQIT